MAEQFVRLCYNIYIVLIYQYIIYVNIDLKELQEAQQRGADVNSKEIIVTSK